MLMSNLTSFIQLLHYITIYVFNFSSFFLYLSFLFCYLHFLFNHPTFLFVRLLNIMPCFKVKYTSHPHHYTPSKLVQDVLNLNDCHVWQLIIVMVSFAYKYQGNDKRSQLHPHHCTHFFLKSLSKAKASSMRVSIPMCHSLFFILALKK
jgi:hypothetical protein